jgi:hypothetical protein
MQNHHARLKAELDKIEDKANRVLDGLERAKKRNNSAAIAAWQSDIWRIVNEENALRSQAWHYRVSLPNRSNALRELRTLEWALEMDARDAERDND